jgi:hypothetical protein
MINLPFLTADAGQTSDLETGPSFFQFQNRDISLAENGQ